ncbi:MAG TPA: hypothetical protein VG755_43605 [Nannocystaceae bacterium]|nr:hypothetical protein [Nannocystaceae bacterium]
MMRFRWWSSIVLSAGCGPALIGDAGDATSIAADDDTGSASPTRGTVVAVGFPGSDGAPSFDAGTTDGVCTDAACFGPSQTLDDAAAWAVAIVDIDGDGVSEVIAGGEDELRILSLAGDYATLDVLGRVVAMATGRLDGDGVVDLVALTDAARVVVVRGGSTPTVTSLAAADGLTDVAIANGDGSDPAFVTVAREGTVALWRSTDGGGWTPSFFGIAGNPATVTVGTIADELIVATGDDAHGRVDVLAIVGTSVLDAYEYPYFDNDPLQLELGWLAPPGAIPDLLVLGDDPPALEVQRFAAGLDSMYTGAALPLAGHPVAFATGWLGYGERDVAIVDEQAGTVELCALVVADEYAPQCPGAVLSVGAAPVAIAIGELAGGAPDDIAIASPRTGITLVTGTSG